MSDTPDISPSSALQTNHIDLCDFYNRHPDLNFEKINLFILQLLETMERPSPPLVKCSEEEPLYPFLNNLFPTSLLKKITDAKFIVHRFSKPSFAIIKFNESHNIDVYPTIQFITDQNLNGIIISEKSGIIEKKNFQIDVVNGNVIVYIHNGDNGKIKTAVDIIDHMVVKLKELNHVSNSIIQQDILDNINNEFQLFISQKTELMNYIKMMNHDFLSKIDNLSFIHLDNYLSTKFQCSKKIGIHKCDICNIYTSDTKKGIAAHKRGCIKKVRNVTII